MNFCHTPHFQHNVLLSHQLFLQQQHPFSSSFLGTNDVVQHGACLGMGLSAMATGNTQLFEDLRQVLFMDNAVAGEGAALAIGLIMVGQSDSELAQIEIPNLLNAAHDSPHEKIVRALSLSIAMMVYGKEESADVLIEQLSRDRDPIIRYGASYALAMAYCGTSDNNAIRKLLHIAVSDVNDDVRRSAVTCLGFISFRNPDVVPKMVILLAESFNPHVRYGACMAVGIACAGLASKDAIDLLTPMLEDQSDFVRQGALISMAFVLQQASEARSPSVKKFRDLLVQIIGDKHQTLVTKTGAILASGIMDAGGRNVVLNLQSKAGFVKMGGAIGMMMFLQYWYWYPLELMLSLAFAPTMLIGLNKDFNMPTNFSVVCHAPPSMFCYPKIEEKKEDEKKTLTTAVLSTTVKAKAREAKKEARKLGRQMSLTSQHTETAASDVGGPTLERSASLMSNTSVLSSAEASVDHCA
jgi:26S proteasome regulatory subunit N2